MWIAANIRWIMIVSGVLTATMIYAAIAPHAAVQAMLGETVSDPVAQIVVRTWGALIGLTGAMLIYAASRPAVRPLVLTVASISKVFFVVLMVTERGPALNGQGIVSIAVDVLMVALFVWYLLAARAGVSGRSEDRPLQQPGVGAGL
jgi:hypothetical protein